jgi:hypothetical protein
MFKLSTYTDIMQKSVLDFFDEHTWTIIIFEYALFRRNSFSRLNQILPDCLKPVTEPPQK